MCSICFQEWVTDKEEARTKLQELVNKFEPDQWSDLDEAARKRRTEHAENLVHFQSFLKGPVYTCKIPNCGKELCEPCLNKMDETAANDGKNLVDSINFKCPFCRQPDWKVQMDGVLFYVKLEANKKMGISEDEYIRQTVNEFMNRFQTES